MENAAAAPTTDGKPIEPLIKPGDLEAANKGKRNGAAAAEEGTLAPPPTKEEARTFAREFLVGELLKAVKRHFVTAAKPFTKMSEHEQESLLRRVADEVKAAVKEAVEVIASDGRLTFRADVDSVTFKDGVKVAMKLAKSEHAHTLADKSGSSVLIVVEDFARYLNPGEETKGEPDQTPLFDASKREEKDAADKLAPARKPKKKTAGRTATRKGRGK